jgi:hypothetical protein
MTDQLNPITFTRFADGYSYRLNRNSSNLKSTIQMYENISPQQQYPQGYYSNVLKYFILKNKRDRIYKRLQERRSSFCVKEATECVIVPQWVIADLN